jgi:adenine-specific DNA-methyltransferase
MATGIQKTKWNGEVLIADPGDDHSHTSTETDLCYQGKLSAKDILRTEPADITPIWQGASDRNRLYFGDNLSILAYLLRDRYVQGKAKLVYIDPPFSTDKVYQSRKQNEAYSDILVGAHYVEFLRRRLILLRELLAEDGSIYVHLDQNMVFHIKIVMDELFGSQNFQGLITRQKCNPKNYTRKTYGNISDHILYYAKSANPTWNRAFVPWEEERALEEYPYNEAETGRRFKKVPVHAPGTRNGATGQPWRGMNPPPGKHWQYPPQTLDAMDKRGEIYWSPTGNPRRKIYLDQSQGIPVQNIWLDVKDAHNQMIKVTGYPTEKPAGLLARIIEASSNQDDLVLDCFSGSGTTLAVASQLGRRWIGVDNSSEAIATTLHRFAHGLEPMGDFVKRDRSAQPQDALPLFDLAGLSEIEPDKGNTRSAQSIEDFALYSVTAYSEHLRQLLRM